MTHRLIETAVVVAAAAAIAFVLGIVLVRRAADDYARFSIRRSLAFIAALVALVAIAFVWDLFSGRASLVIALLAAGLGFALQEMIGAVAGWFNILLGGIYRVGDRIELAGVRGDVIDITPLRTKLLETGVSEPPPLGDPAATDQWVHGRQPTGRIVAVSNKATFDSPVFNYSGMFSYVWQDTMFPISYRDDWRVAERIIREEAERVSATKEAQNALEQMRRRYPLPHADLEPRVFVRATDNYMELSARYLVQIRSSRSAVDALTRAIHDRLDEAGIAISSTTSEVTLYTGQPDPGER